MTDIVVGLEGKGATVDFLAAQHTPGTTAVVRFNGGQQAAHNVGTHHMFSSFGSGTFSANPTFISDYCTIDPIAAFAEGKALGKRKPKIYVHQDAKVTTPIHILVNRRRETERGDDRHGSTGTGFGETVSYHFPEIQIKNNLTTSLPPVRIVSTGANRKERHYND